MNASLSDIRQWLINNRPDRIRPRISGQYVRYIPRKGWEPGLSGCMDNAPAMFSLVNASDPYDNLFRELGIPVDAPL